MWRFLSLLALLSLSVNADAAGKYVWISEDVAVEKVSVEPVNAGINPEAAAYLLKGQVNLASNSCYAQGLRVSIQVKKGPDAKQFIQAKRQGLQRFGLACLEIYQPVFVDVAVTVRGDKQNLAETVFIHNAEELGTLRPLTDYLPKNSDCEVLTFCTREYLPHTCNFQGVEFKGSNRCEALQDVKHYACINNLSIVLAEVSCKADATN